MISPLWALCTTELLQKPGHFKPWQEEIIKLETWIVTLLQIFHFGEWIVNLWINLASAGLFYMHLAEPQMTQLLVLREDQCFHLALHKHGHVHEHVMKLSDTVFQLDNLIVPCLDLIHSLLGDVVHYDLRWYNRGKELERITIRLKTCFFCAFMLHFLHHLPPR